MAFITCAKQAVAIKVRPTKNTFIINRGVSFSKALDFSRKKKSFCGWARDLFINSQSNPRFAMVSMRGAVVLLVLVAVACASTEVAEVEEQLVSPADRAAESAAKAAAKKPDAGDLSPPNLLR